MTDMAKTTKTPVEKTPEAPVQEDRTLTYARRRWAWLKANDLMLVRSLLAQGTLAEHLMETGRHAATEYQRLIVNGELPAEAEKKAESLILLGCDIDPLPFPSVEQTQQIIAQFERSAVGKPFAGTDDVSTAGGV
jgi:hypothetical protein